MFEPVPAAEPCRQCRLDVYVSEVPAALSRERSRDQPPWVVKPLYRCRSCGASCTLKRDHRDGIHVQTMLAKNYELVLSRDVSFDVAWFRDGTPDRLE